MGPDRKGIQQDNWAFVKAILLICVVVISVSVQNTLRNHNRTTTSILSGMTNLFLIEARLAIPIKNKLKDLLEKYEDHAEQTHQEISPKNGRIVVRKRDWIVRIVASSLIIAVLVYSIIESFRSNDPFAFFSLVVLVHMTSILICAWILYRNPTPVGRLAETKKKVSVIIPVYNQQQMIENVIDAIFASTYKNVEVVVVNDGSTDMTGAVLDSIVSKRKYDDDRIKIIHRENGGKRKAIATGFFSSKSDYIVLIDSDSIVHPNAIEELVKTFEVDSGVGALVGCARVWNADRNFLTKCQDGWYDYAFNIHKAAESYFNSVTCCSGCLAAYRREAIRDLMGHWAGFPTLYYHDAMTEDTVSKTPLLRNAASYDDSEDRILTTKALAVNWKSLYVASAVVYTEVPETVNKYLRQQKRWKKGYIRSNAFATTFFWRNRNPLMAFLFYADYIMTFTLPVVILLNLIYQPLVMHNLQAPFIFFMGILGLGLIYGLDYKMRIKGAKNWKYLPIMAAVTAFLNTWLLVPALLTLRKNNWETR